MMYEIGLRFVMKGHSVSVATSWRADRTLDCVEGMHIRSFRVTGNAASGMTGEIARYQDFLVQGQFDFVLVMAAQQWTFDAMLPVLDAIRYRKLHIPCGYSGFYLPKYREYFKGMETHLRKFNALIYNSTDYRDVNFARERKLPNINIIPAGASELEFLNPDRTNIREQLGIGKEDFVYLSVGAPAYNKGHKEILQAYLLLEVPFASTLILNGNYDSQASLAALAQDPRNALKEYGRRALGRSPSNIMKMARKNKNHNKKIVFANLDRRSLISLFFDADLFLFASHVEYSPLVIFECMASGLPFLSIPVGNVDELIEWSGGGILCAGQKSGTGFSSADPLAFSREMQALSVDQKKLAELSASGRRAWVERFTWQAIANQIEQLATNARG
jgi:glycosyltransferase involved in cell wall biosynthesis